MRNHFELLQGAKELPEPKLPAVQRQRANEARPAWNQPQLLLPALGIILKHWRWSLTFALGTVALVAAIVFSMRPVYEPIARVELDSDNELFSSEGTATRLGTSQYAETQAKNLQSEELQLAVIRDLHLDRNTDWLGTLPRTVQTSAKPMPAGNAAALTPAEYKALELFGDSLSVKHDNLSWLISVSFAAPDPKLAAVVTNTLVADFIQRDYKTRNDSIRESTQWLSHELDDIRQRMDDSNRALAEFQKTSGITPVGDSRSSFDERTTELNRQLTLAQVERIQLEALLANGKVQNQNASSQVSADNAVQEISRKLSSLRAEQQQTLVIYGKNHPKAKELQAQIDELEAELTTQKNHVLATLENSFQAAHTRENLLNSEVKSATKQMGLVEQYETLRKEAQANEDLYKSLYAKLKEAAIVGQARTNNIRWVDHARVLDRPTRPRRMLDIAAAAVAGILGGILIAFTRESLNTKLRSFEDVRDWTSLKSISLIPLIASNNHRRLKSQEGNGALHSPRRPFVLQQPNSPEAEALRGLVTSVAPFHPGHPRRVLLVASSQAAEGKTTVAANLAIGLARSGRTCLVDADLRKPSLAKSFGIQHDHGLGELLCNRCTLAEAVVPVDGVPNLTLLPGEPVDNGIGELVTSDRMRHILQALREEFQYVVVDSPPLLPYADARAIAPLVDAILLVARSGKTTREAFNRSLDLLQGIDSAPVLDVVLNAVPHHSADYGYYYGYATNKG
jgi:capsular exopolysaccharide synthesis family protein